MKTAATIIAIAVSSVVIGSAAHAQIGPGDRLGLEPGPGSTTRGTIEPKKEKTKKSHGWRKASARHHK